MKVSKVQDTGLMKLKRIALKMSSFFWLEINLIPRSSKIIIFLEKFQMKRSIILSLITILSTIMKPQQRIMITFKRYIMKINFTSMQIFLDAAKVIYLWEDSYKKTNEKFLVSNISMIYAFEQLHNTEEESYTSGRSNSKIKLLLSTKDSTYTNERSCKC